MQQHWFFDGVLIRLTEPTHIAWVTAALTVVLGFSLVAILAAAMNGLINRGAFRVLDPSSLTVKHLPSYAWLVNNVSGSKNIIVASSLARRTTGNAGLAAFIAFGGIAIMASKLLVASAVIGWATWDFGLCPINATSAVLMDFMDNPVVTSQNWIDDVAINVSDGCPDWLAVPCTTSANLAKTVRVQFSDQAHQYLATPMGPVSIEHDVNCTFMDARVISVLQNITQLGYSTAMFNDRVSLFTSEYIPYDSGLSSDNASVPPRWTSTVTKPGFRPNLSYYNFIWAPGFAVKATPHEDALYNFTKPVGQWSFHSQTVLRPIACVTGLSAVERTNEYGEIRITGGSTSELLNVWNESVKARGMRIRQSEQLRKQFSVLFRSAVFMRGLASDIFGSDLEIANSRFYREMLSTTGLTLETHFAYTARLQQRVARAQVIAAFLGNLDQNYTAVDNGLDIPEGRVKCNGYTISVIRILVVLLPVLLVMLCIRLWDEMLPVALLDRARKRYPGSRLLWWMVQTRLNRQAVEIMQLGKLVEALLGPRVTGMIVRRAGAHGSGAEEVDCALVRAYEERGMLPHPDPGDAIVRDVDLRSADKPGDEETPGVRVDKPGIEEARGIRVVSVVQER
ncbi:hypothetical protein BDZ88DRAFT_491742 [Geranomyces variabilis]|nr:hypothetical protein BDZ88DRAFT_491742 [Geranomyces variabilis]KAJ3138243.1 hypothetical protein HDU90_001205 [Geranomyces variabilis]